MKFELYVNFQHWLLLAMLGLILCKVDTSLRLTLSASPNGVWNFQTSD